MIPIRDSNPTSSTPVVTIGLIVVNIVIFLFQTTTDAQRMIWKYGYVPAELLDSKAEFARQMREHPPVRPVTDRRGRQLVDFFGRPIAEADRGAAKLAAALPAWINIFTCMFLHGGWLHLLGNMLYLWIFGNNIEDRLGPALFIVFYLGTGVVGNLAHTFVEPGYSPLVGASGAVSGVMGAYILLFPRARILAVVPIYFYPLTVSLPAWAFLGIYFVLQNLYPATFGAGMGNVAHWAHIGGFVSGAALIYVFPHRRRAARTARPVDPRDDDADLII